MRVTVFKFRIFAPTYIYQRKERCKYSEVPEKKLHSIKIVQKREKGLKNNKITRLV